MLLTLCLSSIVSCRAAPAPKTVEITTTVKGCTDALVMEHAELFQENIKLKQALKICQTGKCL